MPIGYRLWFGDERKFKGKCLESIFFTAPGYVYIKRFLLETLARPEKQSFVTAIFGKPVRYKGTNLYNRARALYDVGDSLKSRHQCKTCGQSAEFFVAEGAENDGYAFSPYEFYCSHCRPANEHRRTVLPIKFSTVATFGHSSDQALAMRHIRWLLNLDKRMTLEKAVAFFEVMMAVEDVPSAPPLAPVVVSAPATATTKAATPKKKLGTQLTLL